MHFEQQDSGNCEYSVRTGRSAVFSRYRFVRDSPSACSMTFTLSTDAGSSEGSTCTLTKEGGAGSGTPSPAPTVRTAGFVLVKPGSFTMGAPEDELGAGPDETTHHVTLKKTSYVSSTEVTQAQWWALFGNNPSVHKGSPLPVERVTWWEALAYANALSVQEGLPQCYSLSDCTGTDGNGMSCTGVTVAGGSPYACTGYRLPTEAEWEYAYRAGTTSAYHNGENTEIDSTLDPNLDAIGWYCGNSAGASQPVGGKEPNPWGLYDMAGNVAEYVWDWYGDYPETAATDPVGPPTGSDKVSRGGTWVDHASSARAAHRTYLNPGARSTNPTGFRVIRSLP